MNYLRVPSQVTLAELQANGLSWSPGMYRRVIIPARVTRAVRELLSDHINGAEVGSLAYVRHSDFAFLRTKALQEHSYLTQLVPGSITSIKPAAYEKAIKNHPGRAIGDGDILYARGGNIGEVAIAHDCGTATISSHLIRLRFAEHPWYCFAFMKHPACKLQQQSRLKGSIRMLDNFDVSTLLDCRIPFPDQPDAARVIAYVSALIRAIVDKEKAIRDKDAVAEAAMAEKLRVGQRMATHFSYSLPTYGEMASLSRLDTGMYSEDFKAKQFAITNYNRGAADIGTLGLLPQRGQNLQVSSIGRSIYSDQRKPGFYRLVLPTHITDVGTVSQYQWLGNRRKLDLLHEADVVFGAEATFRCAVVCDALDCPTVSNIHAIVLRSDTAPLHAKVFAGAWLRHLAKWGYAKAIAVGGQGGSLAMGYLHHVLFPKFPDQDQAAIAACYHNDAAPPSHPPTLDTFVDWHRQWNADLGVWELDREMKALQATLREVQQRIIQGETVTVPL